MKKSTVLNERRLQTADEIEKISTFMKMNESLAIVAHS